MSAIRRFARQVAKRYQPDKIMLFGSFAYGEPNENSDVDILVVMAARNEIDQSIRHTTKFAVETEGGRLVLEGSDRQRQGAV